MMGNLLRELYSGAGMFWGDVFVFGLLVGHLTYNWLLETGIL
jgi:hypothetical protein